jgi:hypothetical protein
VRASGRTGVESESRKSEAPKGKEGTSLIATFVTLVRRPVSKLGFPYGHGQAAADRISLTGACPPRGSSLRHCSVDSVPALSISPRLIGLERVARCRRSPSLVKTLFQTQTLSIAGLIRFGSFSVSKNKRPTKLVDRFAFFTLAKTKVEMKGIEPTTSSLRTKRSAN